MVRPSYGLAMQGRYNAAKKSGAVKQGVTEDSGGFVMHVELKKVLIRTAAGTLLFGVLMGLWMQFVTKHDRWVLQVVLSTVGVFVWMLWWNLRQLRKRQALQQKKDA